MIAIKFRAKNDRLIAISPISDLGDDELLLITQKGTIVRQRLSAISVQQRTATGVRLQKLDEDDHIASCAIVAAAEEGEEEEEEDEEEDDEDEGEE